MSEAPMNTTSPQEVQWNLYLGEVSEWLRGYDNSETWASLDLAAHLLRPILAPPAAPEREPLKGEPFKGVSPLLEFEAKAAAFLAATGYMAPGKDIPAAMGATSDYEQRRQLAWEAFCFGIAYALRGSMAERAPVAQPPEESR